MSRLLPAPISRHLASLSVRLLVAPAALSLVLAACSSNDPAPSTPAPTQDRGTTVPGASAASDKNPQGVAYPTTKLGRTQGARIPNLKFVGYRAAGTGPLATNETTTIQLADYYNPDGKNGNYKVIHLSAASRWCGPCNDETSLIAGYDHTTHARTGAGIAADLAPIGVVFLQALVDGVTPGKGATPADLVAWVSAHQANFSLVLDPGPTAFATFFDGAAVPWNADIDARSMEIISTVLGYSPSLKSDLESTVKYLDAHPPLAN